jgi:hypothetical protein
MAGAPKIARPRRKVALVTGTASAAQLHYICWTLAGASWRWISRRRG